MGDRRRGRGVWRGGSVWRGRWGCLRILGLGWRGVIGWLETTLIHRVWIDWQLQGLAFYMEFGFLPQVGPHWRTRRTRRTRRTIWRGFDGFQVSRAIRCLWWGSSGAVRRIDDVGLGRPRERHDEYAASLALVARHQYQPGPAA